MPAIVTAQDVHKSFGARRVLDGVSFAVDEQDRVGLIGKNGSGKSTLLRLLAASASDTTDSGPDSGLITRRRGLRIEYVSQEPRFEGDVTVGEILSAGLHQHASATNELELLEASIATLTGHRLDEALARQAQLHDALNRTGWDPQHEIRGLAAALKLAPLDARMATLSIGERRRVALGRALLAEPELLALDEPTNHLDADTVAWLEERLRTRQGALLLVTHDRYFLDRVATRILELDRGQIYGYEGNYSRFIELQAERLANEVERERLRASFVRRELDWIRRGPQARTTKQQARIDRFNEAVSARPTGDQVLGGPLALRLPTGGRLGKTILELHEVSKSLSGKQLFSRLSLLLKPGDRIGVVGENGAGKTTLMRILVGAAQPDEGRVVTGLNTRVAFLDQGRADLDESKTVLAEVSGDGDHVILPDEDGGPVHVRSFLERMGFDGSFADTPVAVLSGGERNRVQLAKLLRTGGNLLLLDEPTNDLDLVTLGVLEDALVAFPGCAVIVSHDRWFLDRVATGILAFEGGGQVVFYEGNYSSYAARRPPLSKIGAAISAAPTAKPKAPEPAKTAARKLTFKERQELDGLESRITEAEARVAALEAELADPAIYKDRGSQVPQITSALAEARAAVEAAYARWQELEART